MVALVRLALIIPGILWQAFVTVQLWTWFVAGQFGLPQITLPQAIGLGLIIATFTTSFARRGDVNDDEDKSDARKISETIVYSLLLPTFLLGYGWVVTWWLP